MIRRLARGATRAGAMATGLMLLVSVWAALWPWLPMARAATDAGAATVITPDDGTAGGGVVLASGGSATAFSLQLPTGSACTGDSAGGDYRVQSFMVPAAVDVATLSFGASGPLPAGTGASFRQPLFATTGSPFVNRQTANAETADGPGPIINIAAFSFGVFAPGDVPAGAYDIGIACTKGPPSATQLDRFWTIQMTFTSVAADLPAGITWTAAAPPPTTTTSSSTTTTSSTTTSSTTTSTTSTSTTSTSTTSTTAPTSTTSTTSTTSSTTTTTAPLSQTTTSTTTASASALSAATSTTLVAGATSGSSAGSDTSDGAGGGGSAGDPSVFGAVAELPRTGSTTSLLVWGVLFLVFGRIAVLLGREPRAS